MDNYLLYNAFGIKELSVTISNYLSQYKETNNKLFLDEAVIMAKIQGKKMVFEELAELNYHLSLEEIS